MTIDKIKKILPTEVFMHWTQCHDIAKMKAALKELRRMIDNKQDLALTGDLINRYYAEIELLEKRSSGITSSEIRVI